MNRSKPCKYIVNKENCPFGRGCRFLHQYREDLIKDQPLRKDGNHTRTVATVKGHDDKIVKDDFEEHPQVPHKKSRSREAVEVHETKKSIPPAVCQFYMLNSRCKYGDKCRYIHPGKVQNKVITDHTPKKSPTRSAQVKTDTVKDYQNKNSHNPPPLTLASFIGGRAHVQRPHKTNQIQKDSNTLREVELEQLHARFPGDACSLLAKSQDKITYLLHFQPTDQDWRGAPTIVFEVTFPATYPNDYCYVELSSDQSLDSEVVATGNKAIKDYWTPDKLGGLMFRPFLRWWDKNMVEILQSPFSEEKLPDVSRSDDEDSDGEAGEDETMLDETPEQSQPVPKSKKGTEMRFVGLDISQTLGTAFWTTLKIVLSCARCKNQQEVEAKEERLYSVVCGRCSNNMCMLYHLALIHSASSTIGYLELTRCTPVDVVFQSSSLTVTCLDCNSDVVSQGFFIGQPKDVYCRRCHKKITMTASGLRFFQHQQSDISQDKADSVTVLTSSKKQADMLLKDGQPLPEYGICQHYKKSHRWLRFPCCGRAFPCDVCHDTVQDHPMEHANRMICGYCSKEQGYSGKGICVRCGADLVSSRHSAHWEGGQGCRSRAKMNRLDKQKYKNSSDKTVCKKAERVGKRPST